MKVLRLNDTQFNALKNVLNHVSENEKEDFESFSTEEQQETHIYKSVLKLEEVMPS